MKPEINISHIPFSRYGAYVSITRKDNENSLMINNVRRKFGDDEEIAVTFLDNGVVLPIDVTATPEKVTVKTEKGEAYFYIRDDSTIGVVSSGMTVKFDIGDHYAYGNESKNGFYEVIDNSRRINIIYRLQSGTGKLYGPIEVWHGITQDKKKNYYLSGDAVLSLTLAIDEGAPVKMPIEPEKELAEIENEWNAFAAKMPECKSGAEFVAVTWYNLWSSFARAEDVFKADTMLMSKKFMSSVWSWDHCFNALTMANVDKQTALDQFYAPFVLQSEIGVLPDMWNPGVETYWATTKPPIHGWCFGKLMDKFDFEKDTLERVYTYLQRWTDWWMTYRDFDGDGVPGYPMGCDSGWDNSTLFDGGHYMETPDLPSFLVLQMKTLARISKKLCNGKENYWNERADNLLSDFIKHAWNGKRFSIFQENTDYSNDNPTSLLSLMPLVLGEYLDKDKADKLVDILKKDFLTENGPATESPRSKEYESDGYWRGPIWAPSTYLIVDGLRRGGYTDLAKDIALRYCRMTDTKAMGNYENFDAITGKGLRAPGYTWSASVYMLFRSEY